jgi:LPS sulfotransferase NodH
VTDVRYLVCATQRSGSTLLCEALKATGVAGRPEEYFEACAGTGAPPTPLDYLAGLDDAHVLGLVAGAPATPSPPYSSLDGIDDWREHLARSVRDGTTANGVFGAKVMWSQHEHLRALSGSPDPLALLEPTHWVWVRRRDTLRQAVSLWRAMQTQAWREAGEPQPTAVYSRVAIEHLSDLLRAQDAAWEGFFADGPPVLELIYEEYAGDLPGVVARVLGHLGVPAPPAQDVAPPLRVQSDGISAEWAEAFRRGISVRPHNTPHPLT